MFAEGQRVAERVEQVRVKEVERIRERLMVVPPKNPGDEVGIPGVHHRVAQARHIRPGQRRGEEAKRKEDQNFASEADDAASLLPFP